MNVVPKLNRQRDKNKQEVGNYFITIDGQRINLKTKNYLKARDRAVAAVSGTREFAPDDKIEIVPNASPPPTNGATKHDDWTADLSAAAASVDLLQGEVVSGPPPRMGDIPPVSEDHTQTSSESDEQPKPGAGTNVKVSPDMIRNIVKQAAVILTELQIAGQEWCWRRWAKVQVKSIDPNDGARLVTQELWEQAIREWIPEEFPIPAWLAAPIVCAALTVPIQMSEMTPIKKTADPV